MDGRIRFSAVMILLLLISGSGTAHAQTVEYVHTDALGSVIAISDSVGQVTERREYEPYGAQLTPALKSGPGYTGHVQDAATGLTYMQQRYYDPIIGMFLSVDPVAADGGTGVNFNRYWYAGNNPYKFVDPDGREIRVASRVDRPRIARMINSLAVGVYGFNKSGQLQQIKSAGESSRYSSHYSAQLNRAISSESVINISIGNTLTDALTGESHSVRGGATQGLGPSPSDQNVVITGQNFTGDMKTSTGDSLTQTPSTILMHELVGHAIPGAVGSDTGNAVSNENKVRIEIPNADLRMRDENHVE